MYILRIEASRAEVAHMFSCEFCEIPMNTFSYRTPSGGSFCTYSLVYGTVKVLVLSVEYFKRDIYWFLF